MTRCYGFVLVTFYEDDPNHYSAIVHNSNPRLAAGYLLDTANEVDRGEAHQV